jgi:hypothetical protein
MIRPGLYIAYGERGRGVFTGFPVPKGTVIEVSPCIDIEVQGMNDYVYKSADEKLSRVAFGYGSLYAHSSEPNMELEHQATAIVFKAKRDIAQNEELTHDYGDEWWETRGLTPR